MKQVTCHDFERLCNEQLDARDAASPALDDALAAHAVTCPACRVIGEQYHILGLAITAWTRLPLPTHGLESRTLASRIETATAPRGNGRNVPLPLSGWRRLPAIAAAALLAVTLGGLVLVGPQPRRDTPTIAEAPASLMTRLPEPPRKDIRAEPRMLAAVLSEAVLDLARETSAPAARVGRAVLVSAAQAGGEVLEQPEVVDTPPDLLQSVGDELNQGVRPLSGSARQAFSFLVPSSMGG